MKSQVPVTVLVDRHKKAFVGMSGGVDSSVSAALLKKAGYAVTGVFIKVWQPDWIECDWKEERLEAMRAAAHLDIPFITLDLEKEYKEGVIDYMIAEYGAGRTPNPDVMCNREVKFGAFWKWAKDQGADFIATGHYARIVESRANSGTYSMLKGLDADKDQSYFLWTLNQNDLPHILFPVGHLKKPAVRSLAKKFKLPNADKKDSQGLCFIGKVDVKEFLKHYTKTEQGNVLNEKGQIIGTHPGALLFTIGERHGFTIDERHKTPEDAPQYVLSKNVEKNTITVAGLEGKNAKTAKTGGAGSSISIHGISWVGATPKIGQKLQAQARYHQEMQDMALESIQGDTARATFKKRQAALTPGQSLVMYDGDECLGGGVIE